MSPKYAFPYEIDELSDDSKGLLKLIENDEYVRLKGTSIVCPSRIKKFGEILYNFEPRPDDIWLIGYPRSGTTLLQEILYLLGTDLDYEKAASQIIANRFPFFERDIFGGTEWSGSLQELLEKTTEKRFMKTHIGLKILHPELLNVGCKVVFALRNPLDAVNSVAHFPTHPTNPNVNGPLIWKLFLNDLLFGGNYFGLLEEAWTNRHNKNVLIVYYEDSVRDKRAAVLKIAEFLDKKLNDEELERLVKHIDIENFRSNRSVNNDHRVENGIYCKNDTFAFIRHGKVGEWKDNLPEDMVNEVKEFVAKKLAAIHDFVIPESWKSIMEL